MKLWQLDRNLQIRIYGETLTSVLFWMYSPFMLIYFSEEFGTRIAGQLMMIPPFIGVFAMLLGGYYADRFGRKKVMVTSLALQGMTLLLFAASISTWVDFIAYLSLNVLTLVYRPASSAMIADLVGVNERKQVFALFYAANNLGVVVGPLLGSIFFYHYRQPLILTSAVITITLFVVMIIALDETLPKAAVEAAKRSTAFSQLKNYWLIFTDRVLFLYIIAGSLIGAVFMQFNSYLAIYTAKYVPERVFFAVDSFHLQIWDWIYKIHKFQWIVDGKQVFGWLVAENGLFVVLFSMLVAIRTQHWSDKKGLYLSTLLFGFSLWFMSFTHQPFYLLLLMATFTIGELIRTPVVQNFIVKIAPEEQRAQYVAAGSLQFTLGRLLSPLTVVFASDFSPFMIFTFVLLASFISILLYGVMFHLMKAEKKNTYNI